MPYSMPLWTIFTKWPLPTGPQCSQPRSAPGASTWIAGLRRAMRRGRTAEHQRIAVVETPHTAGHTGIGEVDADRGQSRGAAQRILVPGVGAVHDQIAARQQWLQLLEVGVGDVAGRQHQPHGARRRERRDQLGQAFDRGQAGFGGECARHVGIAVVRHHVDTATPQAARHVGAHAS